MTVDEKIDAMIKANPNHYGEHLKLKKKLWKLHSNSAQQLAWEKTGILFCEVEGEWDYYNEG